MSFFIHNILEKVINFQKKLTEKNNKFEHFVLTRKYEEKKLVKFFIPLNVDFRHNINRISNNFRLILFKFLSEKKLNN